MAFSMVKDSNSNTFEEWKKRTNSEDNLDRVDAAEDFPDTEDPTQVASVLVSMLDDVDELVRTEAADQLAYFHIEFVRNAILSRLEIEASELVRGYLIQSIGEVGDMRDLQLLRSLTEQVQPIRIRFCAFSGLNRIVSRYVTQGLSDLVKKHAKEAGHPITNVLFDLHLH
jgi:HEAT repeat protein